MELVRAVLHLKNELCQLPPEAYVMVVKVRLVMVDRWRLLTPALDGRGRD